MHKCFQNEQTSSGLIELSNICFIYSFPCRTFLNLSSWKYLTNCCPSLLYQEIQRYTLQTAVHYYSKCSSSPLKLSFSMSSSVPGKEKKGFSQCFLLSVILFHTQSSGTLLSHTFGLYLSTPKCSYCQNTKKTSFLLEKVIPSPPCYIFKSLSSSPNFFKEQLYNLFTKIHDLNCMTWISSPQP